MLAPAESIGKKKFMAGAYLELLNLNVILLVVTLGSDRVAQTVVHENVGQAGRLT